MIMKARFEGKSFWEIEPEKHRFVTDEIILTMAAIYGCRMPETEILASYISDEMVNLILGFGYEDFTVSEIKLSLRFGADFSIMKKYDGFFEDVKYPDIVCASFLSKILLNYNTLRTALDNRIERKIMGY